MRYPLFFSAYLPAFVAVSIPAMAVNPYNDEFDGAELGKHWHAANAEVRLDQGRVILSSTDKKLGELMLVYGPSRVTRPWAVETQMECPPSGSFRCGISLRLTSPRGLESVVGIARQSGDAGLVLLSGKAIRAISAIPWNISREIAHAKQLVMRIESVEKDLSMVRCGVRLPASKEWTWSEPQKLDPAPACLESIRLASFPLPSSTGGPVTVAFEYAHFEGEDFTPSAPPLRALQLLQRAAKMHPFDLETRAELAINAMMGVTDPIRGGPFVFAWLSRPIRLEISAAVFAGEYVDGLAMARIVSGSEHGLPAEEIMRRVSQELMVEGFYWGQTGQGIDIASHKHILPCLLTLHRLHPDDPRPLQQIRESLHAFHRIALRGKLPDGRPYLYFPVAAKAAHSSEYSGTSYHRAKGWQDQTKEPIDTGSAGFHGTITLPFAQYYELTRDPEAAEFLDQFIRFLLERATDFNPDASFDKSGDVTNGQVWSRMMTIEGILIHGLASGRADLVDWAHRAFDQAQRLHGTRFGWLPENLNFNHSLGCETDTMTAQMEIAFLLARKVDDYYWEVAERIAMNQLLAQQLVRVDFLGGPTAEEAASLLKQPGDQTPQRLPLNPHDFASDFEGGTENDFEQIPLRLLGGFASFCSPNEWDTLWRKPQTLGPNYLTLSCNGSGMRALYNVWHHAAWWEMGEGEPALRVNLHWSKNLPGAQIISHLPSSTKLEVQMERPGRLIVRKPDWAQAGHISAQAMASDGGGSITPVPITIRGRWMHLGHFGKNTRVVLSFPDEVVTHRDIIYTHTPGIGYFGPLPAEPAGGMKWGEAVFTTKWRGNAVIDIEPRGEHQPSYDGRQNIEPYIPRHTAVFALDPVVMSPPGKTGEPRTERIVQ